MANIGNCIMNNNMLYNALIIIVFSLFSCEKEPVHPSPEPPTPVERRVEWKWNTSLEEFKGELQINPVLYKDWVILGFASDYQNRNIPLLIGFDKNNGNKIWEYTYPNKNTSASYNFKIWNEYIIITFSDRIVCIHAENRNLVWEDILTENHSLPYAFDIYNNHVFIAQNYFDDPSDFPFNDSMSLIKYNVSSGTKEVLFSERMVKDSWKHPKYFPPVVFNQGNRELVIFTRNFLDSGDEHPVDKIAIDTKTKEVVWMDTMYSHLSAAWNTAPFIFEGNIIAASDYSMYCWNAATGEMKWKTELTGLNKLAGFSFSGPFLHGDKIYAVANDGQVFCLDARFGNILWQITNVGANANGPARGPCNRPIVVDNILYVNTWSDQAFILFDARSGQQLERYRDADYNGRNVLYDEETKTFFVTAQDKLRAFTVKKI